MTPEQVNAEAEALFNELYAIFSRSSAHKAIMDDAAKARAIRMALARKLTSGWVPKKGFRTVQKISLADAKRLLFRGVEAWIASGAAEGLV